MAAIYMWPVDDQILLTTTLYPVEVVDSLQLSVAISAGGMFEIASSEIEATFGVEDGTYIQLRWFYSDGPYDSDIEATFGTEDGTYIQLRWFYTDGPYDSDIEATFGMEDGTLVNKLVTADTPDEALQLSLAINNTCTMDAV